MNPKARHIARHDAAANPLNADEFFDTPGAFVVGAIEAGFAADICAACGADDPHARAAVLLAYDRTIRACYRAQPVWCPDCETDGGTLGDPCPEHQSTDSV